MMHHTCTEYICARLITCKLFNVHENVNSYSVKQRINDTALLRLSNFHSPYIVAGVRISPILKLCPQLLHAHTLRG